MTDLQIALIAIGAALVIGVLSYNRWQEFKGRKSVERAFGDADDDVLMGDETRAAPRREPMLAPQAAAAEADDLALDQTPGAVIADPDDPAEATETAAALEAAGAGASGAAAAPAQSKPVQEAPRHPPKSLSVDNLIDCTIPLAPEAPLRGEKILAATHGLRQIGGKPVHYVGQHEGGGWEEISRGRVYRSLLAGIRMATRNGALNEIEYSEFVTRLRQQADELAAEPDVPDMLEVMPIARSLHQFIGKFDAKLGINVQTRETPWQLNTLIPALRRQGFEQRPDGRLIMPDGDGGALFSLSTNTSPADPASSRLTLLLDVPCVLPAREAFGAMSACAKSLATRLDGVIVDDGGLPLSKELLDEIATQVQAFYAEMEAMQVPAGSQRALRLFG